MLICGDGTYPRIQPAIAEETSRQQITSSLSVPSTRPPNCLHGLIDVDADAATRERLLSRFPEIFNTIFVCYLVSHARRRRSLSNLLQMPSTCDGQCWIESFGPGNPSISSAAIISASRNHLIVSSS